MLNKVILIGRLTKDPDVRYLTNGTAVASFTLAVDRTFKDKDGQRGTDFINIVAWRKTAELCGQYLTKGRQTAVCGRLQSRSYDAKDGSKRYITEVVADEVTFLGTASGSSQGQAMQQGGAQMAPTVNDDDNFGIPMDGFSEIDDMDVPF